jgi:hypothetical protein
MTNHYGEHYSFPEPNLEEQRRREEFSKRLIPLFEKSVGEMTSDQMLLLLDIIYNIKDYESFFRIINKK